MLPSFPVKMLQSQKQTLSRSISVPSRRSTLQSLQVPSVAPCTCRRTKSTQCAAFGAITSDTVNAASTVGTAVGVLLSAAFLAREVLLDQETEQSMNASAEACPNCHGRGMEPCVCTRWSDGDVGCSGCCHTGLMKCRACRGGGTAVPIAVSVRKQ